MLNTKLLVWAALVGFWVAAATVTAMAQSTPEECAALEDGGHRLLCYDALFRIGRVVTPSPSTAQSWSVRTDTSRIDDTKSVYLSTRSLDTYADDFSTKRAPFLTLRCLENTTSLIINFDGDYMGDSRLYGPVVFRVDDAQARDYEMQASTDHHALGLWRGGASIPANKSLLGAKRLLIRATPVNSSAVTVAFDVTGLDEVIGPLREACNW